MPPPWGVGVLCDERALGFANAYRASTGFRQSKRTKLSAPAARNTSPASSIGKTTAAPFALSSIFPYQRTAATQRYPQRSRHASSISTSQSKYCQLCLPARCSAQVRRTSVTLTRPPSRRRFSESRFSAHSRNGPRSHSASGIAETCFRPLDQLARHMAVEHLAQRPLADAVAHER